MARDLLQEIIAASVGQALASKKLDDEADREEARQSNLQRRIDQDTGGGSEGKEGGLEKEADPMKGGAPKRGNALAGQELPPGPSDPAMATGEINGDSIIDKFNVIRSGKSMNDKEIRDGLQKYLGSLTPAQRAAVFDILKSIGKIVAPTGPLNRTQAPQEEPTAVQNARLQMLKGKQAQQGEPPRAQEQPPPPKEPSPQGRPAPAPEPEPPPEEDNSPPIRVGRRVGEGAQKKMRLLLQE